MAHALFEVTVGAEREHVVVAHVGAEALTQVALDDRDAHTVGEALPERPGRDLDAGRVAVLGVTRCARAELAELLDVLEIEAVPGQVQQRVQEHRRVAVGEHEPVAVGPVGVGGVELEDARVQDVGEGREGHRRARVTRVGLLDRVHRQPADDVDRAALELF